MQWSTYRCSVRTLRLPQKRAGARRRCSCACGYAQGRCASCRLEGPSLVGGGASSYDSTVPLSRGSQSHRSVPPGHDIPDRCPSRSPGSPVGVPAGRIDKYAALDRRPQAPRCTKSLRGGPAEARKAAKWPAGPTLPLGDPSLLRPRASRSETPFKFKESMQTSGTGCKRPRRLARP
eukprot:scaffold576_cov260-Pinguiococcus_pyrenoidosus.AAC.80